MSDLSVPAQKSFGEFIADRYGPKWVYAHRSTERLRSQYPNSVVITPKQQRQLKEDYRKVWGREYDPEFWQMLCALRVAKSALSVAGATAANVTVTAAIEAATGAKL